MDITTLTKLAIPILIIIVYTVNLIKGMQQPKLNNGIIISLLLLNMAIILSMFFINTTNLIMISIILTSLISSLLLLNKNIFELAVKILKMDLQWDDIVHRTVFPMSLYIFINPIIYFTMNGNLAIFLNGALDAFNLINILGFQLLLFIFAFMGIGFGTRRSLKQCINRLGVGAPKILYIIFGLVGIFIINFLVWELPIYLTDLISPQIKNAVVNTLINQSYSVDSAVQAMKEAIPSLYEVIIMVVVVGVSEELLFRGALQPRFGNLYTSLLFSVLHFQYLSILAFVNVFLISYLFGIIKNRTNTSTTILIHMIYDFIAFGGLYLLYNII
ncbi:CPBP family intramembrane glutamic endopeptidase [Methanococcus aeolicus]|uniref:CPBP family intramembrane glutamic endopeptidase n=1 Tax=Methanococcus aeolicus TaxID=42879 RepID=UPI0021C7E3AB|nr:CPBP family intramembrane glutamic endopeptidase [Methanococcus aeolicus]UXM85249.1 CPBP family intramembrane metalloprotease [Methanococcus aeolicus]